MDQKSNKAVLSYKVSMWETIDLKSQEQVDRTLNSLKNGVHISEIIDDLLEDGVMPFFVGDTVEYNTIEQNNYKATIDLSECGENITVLYDNTRVSHIITILDYTTGITHVFDYDTNKFAEYQNFYEFKNKEGYNFSESNCHCMVSLKDENNFNFQHNQE